MNHDRVTERPILFSAPMVRAILADKKTQTRRAVTKLEVLRWLEQFLPEFVADPANRLSPYGFAGDRLWVRENGWERPERSPQMLRDGADTWKPYYFDADGEDAEQFKEWGFKRRPSIHMPRRFCRLVMVVTGVRIERLCAISREDAAAEGACFLAEQRPMPGFILPSNWPEQNYAALWDEINGPGAWAANPWVWVVEFKRA